MGVPAVTLDVLEMAILPTRSTMRIVLVPYF